MRPGQTCSAIHPAGQIDRNGHFDRESESKRQVLSLDGSFLYQNKMNSSFLLQQAINRPPKRQTGKILRDAMKGNNQYGTLLCTLSNC